METSLPSLKTDLKTAMTTIDDITAVSFDTWLFNPLAKYVIELHHDDGMTIGVL